MIYQPYPSIHMSYMSYLSYHINLPFLLGKIAAKSSIIARARAAPGCAVACTLCVSMRAGWRKGGYRCFISLTDNNNNSDNDKNNITNNDIYVIYIYISHTHIYITYIYITHTYIYITYIYIYVYICIYI